MRSEILESINFVYKSHRFFPFFFCTCAFCIYVFLSFFCYKRVSFFICANRILRVTLCVRVPAF